MPLVNATLAQLGAEFRRRNAWMRDRGAVDAYVENGTVVVTAPREVLVPLTLPADIAPQDRAVHGDVSVGWEVVAPAARQFALPAQVAYAR